MVSDSQIIEYGLQVLSIERQALAAIEARVDEAFVRAVRLLYRCSGKVVVTGVGKSGIIAQKITATLNSTGTPSVFLHAVDALHGDLGVVQKGDVVIVLSKSGHTEELEQLLPALWSVTRKIIALTGDLQSPLTRRASVAIDCSVQREACPFGLAPTASTTVMLAMGDALSVSLYRMKGMTPDSFAATHPAGTLGKRLMLRLSDIMKRGGDIPRVTVEDTFSSVIIEMSRKRLGCTLVVSGNAGDKLVGIITDGDLRRLLVRGGEIHGLKASQMMTPDPMTATGTMQGPDALALLEEHKRTHLPVVTKTMRLVGIVHLHDLVEKGMKT